MATEENHPSLYSALYNAITDHKLIDDLLQHPEFRRKAGQVCREIAGPVGGEELFQEACLRLLESASHLNSDSIRGEGEFFGWFSQLARYVHLSNVLSAAAVNSCTEKPGCWPDSPFDVPPDDIGRFLAHADACPYHTRILRAEEEALRAALSRARGLDSQGRIFLGDELQTRITDHKRCLHNWREAALKKGEMYGQVALFNDGRKVASCGWFYDFSNHQSRHELNPYAGLQIRGVSSNDPDEDVLLGFYALAGVRHGGKEKLLELDNGYTVCLKVEELGGNYFEIHFRCVDTKMLETNRATAEGGADIIIEEASDESHSNLPYSPDLLGSIPAGVPVSPESAGWWPPPRGLQAAAMFALLLVVAVPCILLGKMWGQMEEVENAFLEPVRAFEAQADAQGKVLATPEKSPPRIKPPTVSGEDSQPRRTIRPELRRDVGLPSPAPLSKLEQTQRAKALLEAQTRREDGRKPAKHKGVPTSEAGINALFRELPADSTPLLIASLSVTPGTKSTNEVDDRRSETSTPTRLMSYENQGFSASVSVVNVSTNGQKHSTNNPVLHIAKDEFLSNKLPGELERQSLRVTNEKRQNQNTARFTVTWEARTVSAGDIKVVMLYVDISKKGETKFAEQHSYMGVGHSLDIAYDDAIRQAVKPVVEWIRSNNGERLSASASETGWAEQQRAALPEATVSGMYSSDAEINPDHVEQNTSRQVKDGCNLQ